ncbi:carboxymuconolactone decarboxylase family protein [Nocardioides sp. ChNu-153]|uniref:carboxymuconolactone decarboxylase family protein n=1 Tax=unclassified Nocardioides TaxID=2615069 RepID=UPI002404B1A9|nr:MULTISPECIES: carboxymuconolactone decarboxylase family protein [unclassified Nocardioides]MDF9715391.1 carboxymuconolactone decarboxylase family protein [Nocardioides sp. ChNu-99]MDN7121796.1 carboxymuconolactone decarboxylase family protein [Nocardioides sp. ChNu-153]
MSAPPPRVAPGGRRDVGVPAWLLARAAGRLTGTEPPAVFLTLGRTRGLFWGWLHFAGRLMPGGRLPRRDTELVILRVATLAGSAYELTQHRRLARRAGLGEAEVARVADGPGAEGWTPRQRLLLGATDALVRDRDLDDETWAAVQAELGDRCAVELLLLVGHYDMLALVLHALRVQPDAPRRRR